MAKSDVRAVKQSVIPLKMSIMYHTYTIFPFGMRLAEILRFI